MTAFNTIGGASPDYTTIQAWDDDAPATLTEIWQGEMRAVTFDENVVIAGSVSTASLYKNLVPERGAEHLGVFGAGPRVEPASSKESHCFTCSEAHARFSGFECNGWHGTSSEAFRANADNLYFEKLIIRNGHESFSDGIHINSGSPSGITIRISNCFFAFIARSAVANQGGPGSPVIYAYNNTGIFLAFGQANTGNPGFGFLGGSNTGAVIHAKNNYMHATPGVTFHTGTAGVYDDGVGGEGTWGTSVNNASSDGSAPGTSPITNVGLENILAGAVSEKVGDLAVSGIDYEGSIEDTFIEQDNATANNSGDTTLFMDDPATANSILWRCNLVNVPGGTVVCGARIRFNITLNWVNMQAKMEESARDWVVGEATWNIYSTGNNWQTAGGRGAADLATVLAKPHFPAPGELVTNDHWFCFGSDLREFVQGAIDGSSGDAHGGDWINALLTFHAGSVPNQVDSIDNATGADRPYLELFTGSPDLHLKSGGPDLLNAGTNLFADANFPVIEDVDGQKRPAAGAWDIGADHFGPIFAAGNVRIIG